MPSLRKKSRGRSPYVATIVRILPTPAFLNSPEIASSRALPIPCRRTFGSTDSAKTQPQGDDPHSQARISPIMKPRKFEADRLTRLSAIRKKRSRLRGLPYRLKISFQYSALGIFVTRVSSAITCERSEALTRLTCTVGLSL